MVQRQLQVATAVCSGVLGLSENNMFGRGHARLRVCVSLDSWHFLWVGSDAAAVHTCERLALVTIRVNSHVHIRCLSVKKSRVEARVCL